MLPVAMLSCYKDKGNYKYTEVSRVTVEFDREEYRVVSLEDNIVITPVIKAEAGSEEGFEYVWAISSAYNPSIEGTYKDMVIDTVLQGGAEARNLDYPVELPPGTYNIYFRLDDTKTGLSYYNDAKMIVSTEFSQGFYVLKEVGGNTDLDLLLWQKDVPQAQLKEPYADVYSKLHGAPIPGRPESFGIAYIYSYMAGLGEYDAATTLNIGAGGDMLVCDVADWSVMFRHSDQSLYFLDPGDITPYYLTTNEMGIAMIASNGHYFSYQMWPWMPGTGLMGVPNMDMGDGFVPSPVALMFNPYGHMIMHDTHNNRLVLADYNGGGHFFEDSDPEGEIKPSPNDIPHTLIYMGGTFVAGGDMIVYMIYEDADDRTQRHIYVLRLSDYDNPIDEIITPDKSSRVNNATLYSCNEKNGVIMYFVHGNKFYMYDISGYSEREITLQGIGAGEQITYVSNKWCRLAEDETFDYVIVGTTTGNDYKLYFYETTGAQPVGAPKYVFEGDGKLFGIHYVSDKMNTGGNDNTNSFNGMYWNRW